jgi:hypothetical protein
VSRSLEERISELRAPSEEASQERASAFMREAAEHRRARPALSRVQKASLGGGLAVLLALTPPVQALAERLGELVGIGDDPTVEKRVSHVGTAEETGAVVIGSGTSPSGAPVELVAFKVVAETGQVERVQRTCYAFDLPPEKRSNGSCPVGTPERFADVRMIAAAQPLTPESQLVIQGVTSADTAQVEVSYQDSDGTISAAPTLFSKLTAPLARRIGSDERGGFFIAFLPELLPPDLIALERDQVETVAEGIRLTGSSEDGEELWSTKLSEALETPRLEIPSEPGNALKLDLPPVAGATDAARPVGSGIEAGYGVRGVPAPFASIGSGRPTAHWLEQCDRLFAGGESRVGTVAPSRVLTCAIFRAQEAGRLPAGSYSRNELSQALKAADVIPPKYEELLP